jgi:hypothetical protein
MKARNGLAVLVLLAVGLTLALSEEAASPGALAKVHARGAPGAPQQCSDCHASAEASLTDACAACHADIGESLRDGRGLHGQLDAALARDCARCHAEHQGPHVALGGETAFALAGVDSVAGFRHEGLDFGLDGAHTALDCVRCHAQAQADPLPAGERRFLGLSQDCTSCHADPHRRQFERGAFAAAECSDCHGQDGFAPARLDAAAHARSGFPLQGAHATAACSACHRMPEGAPDTPEGRAQRQFADVPAACSACHGSPHAEDFLAGVAARQGLADGAATCAQCHAAGDADFTVRRDDALRTLHAAAGFVLDAPHDVIACAACHAGIGTRKLDAAQVTPAAPLAALGTATPPAGAPRAASAAFHDAFPGRPADDCRACHQDVHRGQFEAGPFGGQGCLACHARHSFTPPTFGDEQHALTRFALTGAHLGVGCNACHARAADAPAGGADVPRAFAGTPRECAACHADAHAGAFDAPGRPEAVDGATSCARCHSTSAWDDAPRARFDHALWTGFALDGAHARAHCVACHVARREPDENGRRFDHAAGRACADCHTPGSVREGDR